MTNTEASLTDDDHKIRGRQWIGGVAVLGTAPGNPLQAINPATGELLAPAFPAASAEQIDAACRLAGEATRPFGAMPPEARALFLDAIAEELVALGPVLIERATAETGLPAARIEGERGRTVGQLRLFATLLREGRILQFVTDDADPERKPLPKPALRTRRIGLGPVAVFGASNFPLAFSIAGGDTASALAAGCPVVAKAHPGHPGTSELAASAIVQAAKRTGMPAGVFALLTGGGNALGEAIVQHPAICAVGFTGSRSGGLALTRLAQQRSRPVPVFAEMSSVNPVFVLPGALEERAEAIGKALAASVLLGVGQFCTSPGVVFGVRGPAWNRFVLAAADAMRTAPAGVMLHAGIASAYVQNAAGLRSIEGVETLAEGAAASANAGRALVCHATAQLYRKEARLSDEVFGPASLLVACADTAEMLAAAEALEGQLTCTVHFSAEDHSTVRALLPILQQKAGRLVANGFPTGVEVGMVMVHGGPFPATTDSRFTSVGAMAIERWLRPVCYQDFPEELLV
jgi:alpha-ketoglutaric semialdehyde dehydrogenase